MLEIQEVGHCQMTEALVIPFTPALSPPIMIIFIVFQRRSHYLIELKVTVLNMQEKKIVQVS